MTRLSLFVFILLILPARLPAQAIRIGSLGLSGPLLPLWIAQDKGLFAKQGLTSELITFQGGTQTIQALLSGGIGFPATGTDTGANAREAGPWFLAWRNGSIAFRTCSLRQRKSIRRKSLKEKKSLSAALEALPITRFDWCSSILGIDPDKDVQILQVGDESLRLSALRQGVVDATVLTPPSNLTARNLGFRVLTSLQEAGINYSFDTIFISRELWG